MSSASFSTRSILLLALLAAACRSGAGGSGGSGRDGEPLQLERLMVGSVYGIGSRFDSDEVRFTVQGFDEGLGNAEIASVEPPATATPAKGERAKALLLAHATLHCQGRAANQVEFDFVDDGGPISLEVDGERRAGEHFIALDGAQLGGATVAVTEESTAGVRRGRVRLSGPIEKFAIGGTALRLIDLRLSSAR